MDLELAWDNSVPGASDDVADALDYAAVSERVSQCLQTLQPELLERAAEEVARLLQGEFGVRWLRLTLSKPGAVPAARSVGVRIERGGHGGMKRVYISIGSNIERYRHVSAALDALAGWFGELAISPVYESESVGFDGSDFLNLVVGVDTDMSVGELSRRFKKNLRQTTAAKLRRPSSVQGLWIWIFSPGGAMRPAPLMGGLNCPPGLKS